MLSLNKKFLQPFDFIRSGPLSMIIAPTPPALKVFSLNTESVIFTVLLPSSLNAI